MIFTLHSFMLYNVVNMVKQDVLLLCCCIICFSPWNARADCFLDDNLQGTWNILDGPGGNVTFDNRWIHAIYGGRYYDFVCSDKDLDGKYLLETSDGKRMLCILINSLGSSSVVVVKVNAGHFASVDEFFESDPIPSGYVPSIKTCDRYTGNVVIYLEPLRK